MSTRIPTVTIPLAHYRELMDAWYQQRGWKPPGEGEQDQERVGVTRQPTDPQPSGEEDGSTLDLRKAIAAGAVLSLSGSATDEGYERVSLKPPADPAPGGDGVSSGA